MRVKKYYLNLCSHHKGKFIKHIHQEINICVYSDLC